MLLCRAGVLAAQGSAALRLAQKAAQGCAAVRLAPKAALGSHVALLRHQPGPHNAGPTAQSIASNSVAACTVQEAAVRDPGAANGEGRLTMGETHAPDAFSFLPPGQPADGAGEA